MILYAIYKEHYIVLNNNTLYVDYQKPQGNTEKIDIFDLIKLCHSKGLNRTCDKILKRIENECRKEN